MSVSPDPMTTSVLAGGEDTDAARGHVKTEEETSHSARSPGAPGVPDVGRDRKDLLQSLQRAQPCQQRDFRLLASRTVREYMSVGVTSL